jgi:hypothetical protein
MYQAEDWMCEDEVSQWKELEDAGNKNLSKAKGPSILSLGFISCKLI